MAMLTLSGVTKSFLTGPERLDVLQGVDLVVDRGEIVAIVGELAATAGPVVLPLHPRTAGNLDKFGLREQ